MTFFNSNPRLPPEGSVSWCDSQSCIECYQHILVICLSSFYFSPLPKWQSATSSAALTIYRDQGSLPCKMIIFQIHQISAETSYLTQAVAAYFQVPYTFFTTVPVQNVTWMWKCTVYHMLSRQMKNLHWISTSNSMILHCSTKSHHTKFICLHQHHLCLNYLLCACYSFSSWHVLLVIQVS